MSESRKAPKKLVSFPPGKAKLEKVTIASLDDSDVSIEAQYNPKELSIEKSITWSDGKAPKNQFPEVEFTGGGPRVMTIELFFDGYEDNKSVQYVVDDLLELATVRDMDRSKETWLRPHQLVLAWGATSDGRIPPFYGVIDSISTKYSMFLPDGTPVRATCSVKIKEARPQRSEVVKRRK